MGVEREKILLTLQSSLLGEVYQELRAVVFRYSYEHRHFVIRYYLDREPNEDDYESVGNVVAEFISNFKHSNFERIEEECVYTKDSISELDIMDGMVYCRKEY